MLRAKYILFIAVILMLLVSDGTSQQKSFNQGAVKGRVLDQNNQSVAGAYVRLYYQAPTAPLLYDLNTKTNDKGDYEITGIKVDTNFCLTFWHPNSYLAWERAKHEQLGFPLLDEHKSNVEYYVAVKRDVQVKNADEKLTVEAQLLPVEKTKLSAKAHIQTSIRQPIKYREVVFMGEDKGLVLYTDSDGNVQAHGLPPGKYDVVVPLLPQQLIEKPVPQVPKKTITIKTGQVEAVTFETSN